LSKNLSKRRKTERIIYYFELEYIRLKKKQSIFLMIKNNKINYALGARFRNLANARTKSAGFTLIEVLIIVAILAVIATIGSVYLFNYYSRQNLSLTVNEIIAVLREAYNGSITQENGDQWGVRFSNVAAPGSIKLFRGSSFDSGILISSLDLRAGVQFIYPVSGNSADVIFSKVTGYPNASTSIKVALTRDSNASSSINISVVGQISK